MNMLRQRVVSKNMFYNNNDLYEFGDIKILWILGIDILLIAVTVLISIFLGDLIKSIFFYGVPLIMLLIYLKKKQIPMKVWFRPINTLTRLYRMDDIFSSDCRL